MNVKTCVTCEQSKPIGMFKPKGRGTVNQCNRCAYFIARAQYEGRCVAEIGTCPNELLENRSLCADHRGKRVRRLRATARKFSDMYPELADWAGVS